MSKASIQGIKHVGVFVRDLERSINFYQNVLGLKLEERMQVDEQLELAFLSFSGDKKDTYSQTTLELVHGRDVEAKEGRVNHLAFSVQNIDEMLVKLKQHEVELIDETAREVGDGKMRVAFFRGPDGEKLELVE